MMITDYLYLLEKQLNISILTRKTYFHHQCFTQLLIDQERLISIFGIIIPLKVEKVPIRIIQLGISRIRIKINIKCPK